LATQEKEANAESQRLHSSNHRESHTQESTKGSTGPFYLRYELNGRRIWESLATHNHTFALAAARTKESSLLLWEATPPKPSPAAPKSLGELRTAFIHDKKTTFKKDLTPLNPDTISSYEKVTREFLDIIKKQTPAQVTKQDLKDWMVKQRERVSHRTVCNLYISIACFLHFCGVDHKKLLPQSERPSPVEETPEAYAEKGDDEVLLRNHDGARRAGI
jgi:hypothetical protein